MTAGLFRSRHASRSASASLLILAGLLTLTACAGGGDASNDDAERRAQLAPAAAETAGGEIDPCALVTGAEATQVLEAPAGEPERPSEANNSNLATCRYVAPRGQSVAVLVIMVHSREYGRIGFQTARQQPFESQAVPGVGDDAFWISEPINTLYVLQGDVFLAIGGDVPLDEMKSLALRAVGRLRY